MTQDHNAITTLLGWYKSTSFKEAIMVSKLNKKKTHHNQESVDFLFEPTRKNLERIVNERLPNHQTEGKLLKTETRITNRLNFTREYHRKTLIPFH